MHPRRSFIAWFAVGSAACAAFAPAFAQQASAYPDKPIRIVVGYPPGGSSDFSARVLGTRLATALNQSVVIDNRGVRRRQYRKRIVVRSGPMANAAGHGRASITVNASVYANLPFWPRAI